MKDQPEQGRQAPTRPAAANGDTPASPLAAFEGARPPAPAWFTDAIAREPARTHHTVEGARIETLSWGERGKPGLLLLHGNGAHADWWSFIAPFFADDYRVAALSWSGMGGSDWREHYTLDLFVAEILGVAEAEGLFEAGKPVAIGHSFGGMPLVAAAARHGERLRGAIIADSPLMPAERRQARRSRRGQPKDPRPTQVYPTIETALARFRFMPPQGCDNLYIADHIARTSLREVPAQADMPGGYTWRFDPFMWKDYHAGNSSIDLANVKCPVALLFGARSSFLAEDVVPYMSDLAPAGTPVVMLPEAEHHLMVDQPLAFVTTVRTLLATWAR